VGVAGDLSATGSSLTFGAKLHTNAPGGTGSWNFEGGTNYLDESGTAAVTIAQADANVSITPVQRHLRCGGAQPDRHGSWAWRGDLSATGSKPHLRGQLHQRPGGTGSWNFRGRHQLSGRERHCGGHHRPGGRQRFITPYSGTLRCGRRTT